MSDPELVVISEIVKKSGRATGTVYTLIDNLGIKKYGMGGRNDPFKITAKDAEQLATLLAETVQHKPRPKLAETLNADTVRLAKTRLQGLVKRMAQFAKALNVQHIEIDFTTHPPTVKGEQVVSREVNL